MTTGTAPAELAPVPETEDKPDTRQSPRLQKARNRIVVDSPD
jgi:hypothetical protein